MCTGLLIPHAAFVRLVREMHADALAERQFHHRLRSNTSATGVDGERASHRWEASALLALQEMAEHILVMYFELLYVESIHFIDISAKIALHGNRQTIMPRDSALLRDIVQTIDPDHPLGKMSQVTSTSKIQQWLEERHKQAKRNERFEQSRIEKEAQGLYPHWKNNRRFVGWRDEPMNVVPKKVKPWWEEKLDKTQYNAGQAAYTI
jgi:histone H3/H4